MFLHGRFWPAGHPHVVILDICRDGERVPILYNGCQEPLAKSSKVAQKVQAKWVCNILMPFNPLS